MGALILGKKFAMTTILSTFYYPFILGVLQKIPQLPQTGVDMILGAVFGGCMIGIGIGIVIRCGASTGGMDIPPLVLNNSASVNPPLFWNSGFRYHVWI